MKKIQIKNKIIGESNPCFIIAEAGVNHNGSIEKAKKLIDIAKDAKVDAVKFQTWITEEIVTKNSDICEYQKNNTGETNQFDMIKKLELSFNEFKILKEYADSKNIIFMSTPDDEKSADFLHSIGMPAFKIGSGELTNHRMLKKIAEKKYPIILSTGMANLEEVKEAVKVVQAVGCNKLLLLHCTSNYPAKLETVNLLAMKTLEKEFNVLTGYSDHTEGIQVPILAALMGAKVIEKHYTYDKNACGPDHKASLSPSELKQMVKEIREIDNLSAEKKEKKLKSIPKYELILGDGKKIPTKSEEAVKKIVRKSIVAARNIQKGEKITEEMLVFKRPGTGLQPAQIKVIINKTAKTNILKDDILKKEMLEE